MNNKILVALLFFIFYTSGIAIYGYLSFSSYYKDYMSRVDNKLLSVAQSVSHIISPEYHDKMNTLTENEYLEFCTKLSKLSDDLKTKYIYTMIQKENNVHFTSSSYTSKELEDKSYTKFMDVYDDASPNMLLSFQKGSVLYDDTMDKWGTFRSVYLPLKSTNGTSYIIGVDIEISKINSRKVEIIQRTITDALFYFLLILPAFIFFIYVTKKEKEELQNIIHEKTSELREFNNDLKLLTSQLAKYLSPQIYEMLFNQRCEVIIGTKRKKLTVFFSDIKNFTTMTDSLEPEDLTFLLNSYLNEMSNVAIAHGATIDKFIGDAILIFIGDPESKGEKEDALECINMAIDMQNRLDELREMWKEKGLIHALETRIGITTGFCTVGNFGSDSKMDYTIIGNTVNLASRLESNAPSGGILISEETYLLVKNDFACEMQNKIEVKGFKEPVQTYLIKDSVENEIIKDESSGYSVRLDVNALSSSEVKKLLRTITDVAQKKGFV